MRQTLGQKFLGRLCAIAVFLTLVTSVLVVARLLLANQALSFELFLAVVLVQLPHAVYLAAGLAAYWLMDDLVIAGQLDLLQTSGVSLRRVEVAILFPALALTLVMAVANTTVLRKLSRDLPTLRARAELSDSEAIGAQKKILRVGDFRLSAGGMGDPGELVDVVASAGVLVIEAARLRFLDDALVSGPARVTVLEPIFAGTVGSAAMSLPAAAPWSWRLHLEHQPAATARSLAFALDILPLVTAALVCARRGGRARRLRWVVIWLAGVVLPVLVVQNAATVAFGGRVQPELLFIPAVPLFAAAVWFALALVWRR